MASGSFVILAVSDLYSSANVVEPGFLAAWHDLTGGQCSSSVHRNRRDCSGAIGGNRWSRSRQDNAIREAARGSEPHPNVYSIPETRGLSSFSQRRMGDGSAGK